MSDQRVKTSVRLWSTECALADASDLLDRAQAGIVAVESRQPYPRAYEFSNGRCFADSSKARDDDA